LPPILARAEFEKEKKNLVIVSFPAKVETLDQLKKLLVAALPDTRSFDGYISVRQFIEESSNTIHPIED